MEAIKEYTDAAQFKTSPPSTFPQHEKKELHLKRAKTREEKIAEEMENEDAADGDYVFNINKKNEKSQKHLMKTNNLDEKSISDADAIGAFVSQSNKKFDESLSKEVKAEEQ